MNKYLIEHLETHPNIASSDIIKFCYQATFGAEHLLKDLKAARYYFDIEYDSTNPVETKVIEVLSDQVARVNFSGYKYAGYDKEALWEAFVKSASKTRGSEQELIYNLNTCCNMLLKHFDKEKANLLIEEINNYLDQDIRPVHHSDIYRNSYEPHYRLIDTSEIQKILKR